MLNFEPILLLLKHIAIDGSKGLSELNSTVKVKSVLHPGYHQLPFRSVRLKFPERASLEAECLSVGKGLYCDPVELRPVGLLSPVGEVR